MLAINEAIKKFREKHPTSKKKDKPQLADKKPIRNGERTNQERKEVRSRTTRW